MVSPRIYMVRNILGFSLVEVLVAMGILSLLITGAFFVGFPEYNRYVISSEREYLVDALLESRARSFASSSVFFVSVSPNGYCIQDSSGLCVVPFHNLPANMTLTSTNFATSTEMIISFVGIDPKNLPNAEIIIDQNGFIDGR